MLSQESTADLDRRCKERQTGLPDGKHSSTAAPIRLASRSPALRDRELHEVELRLSEVRRIRRLEARRVGRRLEAPEGGPPGLRLLLLALLCVVLRLPAGG